MFDDLDRSDYGFDFERSVATTEGSNVANHLLRELMEAMGISLVARAQTPREVWTDLLVDVKAAYTVVGAPRLPRIVN